MLTREEVALIQIIEDAREICVKNKVRFEDNGLYNAIVIYGKDIYMIPPPLVLKFVQG
jgi:hypothetical protein